MFGKQLCKKRSSVSLSIHCTFTALVWTTTQLPTNVLSAVYPLSGRLGWPSDHPSIHPSIHLPQPSIHLRHRHSFAVAERAGESPREQLSPPQLKQNERQFDLATKHISGTGRSRECPGPGDQNGYSNVSSNQKNNFFTLHFPLLSDSCDES